MKINILEENSKLFEFKECHKKYLSISIDNKYTIIDNNYSCYVINYNEELYIFNLEDYRITKFYSYFIYNYLTNMMLKYHSIIIISKLLLKFNTFLVYNSSFKRIFNITQESLFFIDKINDILKDYCSQSGIIKIKLDYKYMFDNPVLYDNYNIKYYNGTLLCLMYNDKCISNIEIELEKDGIYINSKTDELYEGRKFNKLLRTILLNIIELLGYKFYISYAINPISAYLLFDIYPNIYIEKKHIENEELFEYMESNKIDNINKMKYDDLQKLYTFIEGIYIEIPVDDENLLSSTNKFSETLTKILC